MKIDNINIGLVNKFIENGLNTINKILEADDFLEIEGIKEKWQLKFIIIFKKNLNLVN